MTTTLAAERSLHALYPPTVEAALRPLPLRQFLLRFVRNPLASLPQAVYEERIVVYDNGRAVIAWVTDPALIEKVLLSQAEQFPKTPLEKQVFEHTLGDGILTSQGANWRWQRRTAAPLFRPADLASLVPAMSGAAEDQLQRWRASPAGALQAIDRDMTETTFHVISATMFAGSADAEAASHPQVRRQGALDHIVGHRRGAAALSGLALVPGQVRAPAGRAKVARCGCRDPGATACRRGGRATTCWRAWQPRATPTPASPCRTSSSSTT